MAINPMETGVKSLAKSSESKSEQVPGPRQPLAEFIELEYRYCSAPLFRAMFAPKPFDNSFVALIRGQHGVLEYWSTEPEPKLERDLRVACLATLCSRENN